MKGPAAKTTALRLIDGDSPERFNFREPQTKPLRRVPPAPDWLSDAAKVVFRSAARKLHALGILTSEDVDHLARYAQLEVLFRKTASAMEIAPMLKTQSGGLRANPIGSQAASLAQTLRGYASDLGLSAASRSAIRVPEEDDESDEAARRLLN